MSLLSILLLSLAAHSAGRAVPASRAPASAPRTATSASRVTNTCGPEHVADCAALKAAGPNLAGQLGYPRTQDGSIVFNPWSALSRVRDDFIHPFEPADEILLERFAAPSPARKEAALKLAERVRLEAIELVRGDIRSDVLTAEQRIERDALVKKLETVQITFVENEDSKCSRENPVGFPNASYRPFSHSIELCPAIASQSPQAIVRAIAHEFGHPLMPCFAKNALYKVVPTRATRSDLRDCDPDFVTSEDSPGNLYPEHLRHLENLTEGKIQHLAGFDGDRVLQALVSCRIIERVPEGTPTTAVLFAETQKCTERQNATRLERLIDDQITYDRSLNIPRNVSEPRVRRENPPECFNRTQEQFADSFAAKLIDRFSEKERYSEQQTKALFVEFAGYACNEANGGFKNEDAYPGASERVRNLASGAYVSSRLKCEPPDSRDSSFCAFRSVTVSETRPAASVPQKRISPTRPGRAKP